MRIAHISGVGPKTATAVVAAVGDGTNSRTVGIWRPGWGWSLGNSPLATDRSCWGSASGGKPLRTLLVQGARSVVPVAAGRGDRLSCWINALRERYGVTRTIVAAVNKNARIIWAMWQRKTGFQRDPKG